MDFVRIGDKLIHRERVIRAVDEVFALRAQGLSQSEVAGRVGTDRSFVSRLESLGEVRKGGSIAIVGFPIANKEEILRVAEQEAVDYTFVMSDRERWEFLERPGTEIFNEVMALAAEVRKHPTVIILGANRPAQFLQAMLDREVAVFRLDQVPGSPGEFDPEKIRLAIRTLRSS
jgi:transcriptional regulator with XRE-family HTH domain